MSTLIYNVCGMILQYIKIAGLKYRQAYYITKKFSLFWRRGAGGATFFLSEANFINIFKVVAYSRRRISSSANSKPAHKWPVASAQLVEESIGDLKFASSNPGANPIKRLQP